MEAYEKQMKALADAQASRKKKEEVKVAPESGRRRLRSHTRTQ